MRFYYNLIADFKLFPKECQIGYSFSSDLPSVYPLIYFDAIIVVYEKLLFIYSSNLTKEKNDRLERINYEIKNSIFSCLYAFSSFAKDAVKVGNSNGVALASMRLKGAFEEAEKSNAEEIAKDAIGEITETLLTIASFKNNMVEPSRIGDPIEMLEKVLISASYKYKWVIKNEVSESLIKIQGDHDERWNYIKSLGMKLGSNFGFMFDEATGLNYAPDDPRRR